MPAGCWPINGNFLKWLYTKSFFQLFINNYSTELLRKDPSAEGGLYWWFHYYKLFKKNIVNDFALFCRMAVCMYTLPRILPSARCLIHAWRVRINDVMLWVLYAVPLPSSFISVSENVIFHLQRRKLQRWPTGEKTIWYVCAPRKDDINWYRM